MSVCPHCNQPYDPIQATATKPLSYRDAKLVLRAVCDIQQVDMHHLTGQKRRTRFVNERHTASWILHRKMGLSLPDVGELLGGRCHTTILNGVRQVDRSPAWQSEALTIMASLQGPEAAE